MRDDSRKVITLPRLVARHVQAYIDETTEGKAIFARRVREHHEANYVKPSVHWSRNPDAPASMLRDGEKLFRYLDNAESPKFPGEILESIIACLPQDRRFALQTELAARQHLVAVPMPEVAGSADADNIGRMAKEAGEAISAAADLLSDGVIDKRDATKAPNVVIQLDEAIATIYEMRARIEQQALGKNQPLITMVKG